MIFIGIDPGLKGGLAVIDGSLIADLRIMPAVKVGNKKQLDERQLVHLFKGWKSGTEITTYIELVGSRPGQGVTSMFNFGLGWGIVRGILSGLSISYELVRPQAWKKVMLAGMPKGSEYQVASRLWPDQSWMATPRCTTAHDGMIDAALIAEYGRRRWSGEK